MTHGVLPGNCLSVFVCVSLYGLFNYTNPDRVLTSNNKSRHPVGEGGGGGNKRSFAQKIEIRMLAFLLASLLPREKKTTW